MRSSKKSKVLGFGTLDQLMKAVLLFFPTGLVSEDEDGEIVIHTGYKEGADGRLKLYDVLPK